MVPTRYNSTGLGLGPEPNRCNWSYHMKTQTLAIGPVLPPKPGPFKSTILPLNKSLSSDCIMTWSVSRLCSFSPSFTSRSQICDQTIIHWVAVENPRISTEKWCYFTAIQQISVQSEICHWEVKEGQIMHNLHIDHIVIQSELWYLIGGKGAGTVIWNRGPGPTWPKNHAIFSGPGNNPAKTKWVWWLAGFGTKPNRTTSQKPDRRWVTRTHCQHYRESTCSYGGSFRMLRNFTHMMVKFCNSWGLCADLRETSIEAVTTAQLCGRLRAVSAQLWFIHNHKAFRLIILVFVTVTRFATS